MEENKPNEDLNPEAPAANLQPAQEKTVKRTTTRKPNVKPIETELVETQDDALVPTEESLDINEAKPEKKSKKADKRKKEKKDKDKKKEKEKKAKKKKKEKAKKEKAKKKLKEKKAKKKASKKKKK